MMGTWDDDTGQSGHDLDLDAARRQRRRPARVDPTARVDHPSPRTVAREQIARGRGRIAIGSLVISWEIAW